MWRRPLAYGQATATRIFLADRVSCTAVNHKESIFGVQPSEPPQVGEDERAKEPAQKAQRPYALEVAARTGAVVLHARGRSVLAGRSRRREDRRQVRSGTSTRGAVTREGAVARSGARRRECRRRVPGGSHTGSCRRHNGGFAGARFPYRPTRGRALRNPSRRGRKGGPSPGSARAAGRRDGPDVRGSKSGHGLGGRDRRRLGGSRRRKHRGRWRWRRPGSGRRRRLGGRDRRRRGCRQRRSGSSPRREQRTRVDICLPLADTDAEMHIGHVVLDCSRRTGLGDRRALGDERAAPHEERPQMGEGRLVPVGRRDRHGEAVRRNLAGERDLSRRRRPNDGGLSHGDVDAAVLAPGIRIVAERELLEDRPVRRPSPGSRIWRGDERPERGRERDDDRPRWLMRKHDARVVAARSCGNGLDEVVTETRGRASSARRP
jgi:hypothetical protein